jgi:hypothetical protein
MTDNDGGGKKSIQMADGRANEYGMRLFAGRGARRAAPFGVPMRQGKSRNYPVLN